MVIRWDRWQKRPACCSQEFNRLGVLQSQMFIKDPSFTCRNKLVAGPAVLGKFDMAIQRSQALVEKRLVGDGNDRDALLALAFAAGLQAECLALMQNRGLAAFQYARQATSYAQRLLAVCPHCYAAYVATGEGGYWIGSRTVPARLDPPRERILTGSDAPGLASDRSLPSSRSLSCAVRGNPADDCVSP